MTDTPADDLHAMFGTSRGTARAWGMIAQDHADYTLATFARTARAVAAMTAAGTPDEMMRLGDDYWREGMDALVAHASRTTEASLKLAGEIAAPMHDRRAAAAA